MTKAQQIEAALALVEKLQTNETWTIGDAIRLIRVEKGLSPRDLVKGKGVDPSSLYRIEMGNETRIGTLVKVADALGMRLSEIVARWEECCARGAAEAQSADVVDGERGAE